MLRMNIRMLKNTWVVLAEVILLLGLALPAFASSAENEECRVRIENREHGKIAVSSDRGATWTVIGRVLRPNDGHTQETGDDGFTAADWAPSGAVAATAVNALHIKIRQGTRHAVLFTIQPRELLRKTAEEVKSYFSSPTSIFTDIPAGRLLFGPDYAPRLGNPVHVIRNGELFRIPEEYKPRLGDTLVIPSLRPSPCLKELRFVNRPGGLVFAAYSDGSANCIGRVAKPVGATGRFGGSQYAGRGEIRANHPGVLCVSTSKRGDIGGFQIIPDVHAGGPGLKYVWGNISAWMVVRPLLPGRPLLEGRSPLFGGHIRPGTGRCLVRTDDGRWEPVPERVGLVRDGLRDVTEIRLTFANGTN
ncbi:hypothetical protein KBA41_09265 [Candidatus Ozemobacteraceae bacterium]|nr:hypothetical protein [Candidatus Ozemobacteraceae bacterium]